MKSLILASFALLGVRAQFAQYSYFSSGRCETQPLYARSQPDPNCQASCTPLTGSVYRSQKIACSSEPLNIEDPKLVQLYVASYSYFGVSDCSNTPSGVELVMADARLHPSASKSGVITEWLSVNCNNGAPIFKRCKDSSGKDCEVSNNSGNCESLGAGASKKVVCVYPPNWNGRTGNARIGGTDDADDLNDASKHLATGSATLAILAFLLMAFIR
jgi:hypothetical protein